MKYAHTKQVRFQPKGYRTMQFTINVAEEHIASSFRAE